MKNENNDYVNRITRKMVSSLSQIVEIQEYNLDDLTILVRDLKEIEKEFQAQIEKISTFVKPTHIDSANYIHAIPEIFEIVCKLAQKYDIPYVRSHFEEFYIVPDLKSNLNIRYPLNILKLILLYLTIVPLVAKRPTYILLKS